MIIDILTLFPEMYDGFLNSSIIKRAIEKEIVTINIHDYRLFSTKQNKRVDDYSYGGGAGMVIEALPVINCIKNIGGYERSVKILTTPSGTQYDEQKAMSLANKEHLIIVCGHYEGIDERCKMYIDEEVSIGDFILTGGELASMVISDSVIRLLKGALGNEESIKDESFSSPLLEYPQYTRPEEVEGVKVPSVLLSGNHEEIRRFRRFKSLEKTYKVRKDLIKKLKKTKEDETFLEMIKKGEDFK